VIVEPDDPMLDPAFKPCRSERCAIDDVHAEHTVIIGRGRQCKHCPVCNALIVRAPRKWARCSKCPWRMNTRKKEADARDQP